jgi:hypothetical protein
MVARVKKLVTTVTNVLIVTNSSLCGSRSVGSNPTGPTK